jgi:hypothetical protein
MNNVRFTSIFLALAATVLSGLPAVSSAQGTITINGCSSLTLVSGTTFQCNTTTPDPSGPTGCSVVPATTSLAASGGNVTLSASCSGGAPVTGVTWTKNGQAFSGVFPDALPANSGSSANSYTYAATFNWAGTPAVTASATATVASNSPPPPPPPVAESGSITCTGYTIKTVDFTITPDGNATFSAPMGYGEIVVGRFRTSSSNDTQVNVGFQSLATFTNFRTFALTTDPCDFGSSGPNIVAWTQAKSVMWTVSVGEGQRIALSPNTLYYMIVRNKINNTDTCKPGYSCSGYFQVQNP